MKDAHAMLKSVWGYESFRPLQEQVLKRILDGGDSLTVLPTGAGKSLCFQLPALCLDGIAIVISPLISLMTDQVSALAKRGIRAAALHSGLSEQEQRERIEKAGSGALDLLYLSPERAIGSNALTLLGEQKIAFFAIDEAHCASEWGHDFRPEYAKLKILREKHADVSMHAFTATASEGVRKDVIDKLGLCEPRVTLGDFDRPNLNYRILRSHRKMRQIMEVVGRHQGRSGILYCGTRREVEMTTAALVALGENARGYHAGMSDDERTANQNAFLNNECEILVATVAFGMGIDKPDVRFVIHTGLPKSIENYQQESGRAGRDGEPAECVILHRPGDYLAWKKLIALDGEHAADSLQAVYDLCNSVTCRHKWLANRFGQEYGRDNCGACDVCLGELELVEDPVRTSQKILSCVVRLKQKFGVRYTARVLAGQADDRIRQAEHDQLSTFGLLSDVGVMTAQVWIEQLIQQKYIAQNGKYRTLSLTAAGKTLLSGDGTPKLTAVPEDNGRTERDGNTPFVPSAQSLASFEHFQNGGSVDAVANKMARAKSTIVNYLTEYVRYHRISDSSPWVDPATAARVLEHKHLADAGKLKPLFEHFRGEVSYDEIRITLECDNAGRRTKAASKENAFARKKSSRVDPKASSETKTH
ncbi:MAG: RecQ family ATP-dependent DNA helicase [Planctomycetota bacterium]